MFFKHLQSLWRSYWTHDGTSWNQRLPLFWPPKACRSLGGNPLAVEIRMDLDRWYLVPKILSANHTWQWKIWEHPWFIDPMKSSIYTAFPIATFDYRMVFHPVIKDCCKIPWEINRKTTVEFWIFRWTVWYSEGAIYFWAYPPLCSHFLRVGKLLSWLLLDDLHKFSFA